MIPYCRHDLLWLSKAGREYALKNIQSCIPQVELNEKSMLILGPPLIPAIVRKQEAEQGEGLQKAQLKALDGYISAGFSSPVIIDGVRLRIGSKVLIDSIEKRLSPIDVVDLAKTEKKSLPFLEILNGLARKGVKCNIKVGCFGSAALQLVTGLPYWRDGSDLDIYLQCNGTRGDLELFFKEVLKYEEQSGITIDAEIEFPGFYGVKLKEFFAPGNLVLGKGLYDVKLFNKLSFPKGAGAKKGAGSKTGELS
ncbi:MAG: malonate decarboxylase holo-[acyl-carrier-protein] synthase [Treponema sp.]|nr:malonate decarboxylase holo-[acyl-carrier-protein] synthase [Treponema sp.]